MRTIKAEITLSKDRDAISKVAIHSEVITNDTYNRVSRGGRDRYYTYTDYEVKDIIKKLERIIKLELGKL